MRLTRAMAGAAVVAAVLSSSACSDDSGRGSALGSESPSTSPSSSASGSSGAVSAANVLSLVARSQIAQRSYEFTTTATSGSATEVSKGRAIVGRAKPKFVATLSTGKASYDVISTGGKVYARGGSFGRARWVSAELGATTGPALGISRLGATDPTRTLVVLGTATRVQRRGTTTIRGTSVQHVRATITKATYLATHRLPSSQQSKVADKIVVDLYLAPKLLPVRAVITVQRGGTTAKSTTDFSGYGTKVSVAAPSSSDVVAAPTVSS